MALLYHICPASGKKLPFFRGVMAHFYTLVSRDTRDQEFSANRQLFLTEQGYSYTILYADEVADYETKGEYPGF